METLDIYPNPTRGSFMLMVTSGIDEKVPVIFSNMLGQKVKEATITTNVAETITMNVPDGIYFLSVATPQGVLSKKICVKQ